jgi:hypothetical protein
MATPYPFLKVQSRIVYEWRVIPVNAGKFKFGGPGVQLPYLNNIFIPEIPDTCQLYYIVSDTENGYADTSDYKTVSVQMIKIIINEPKGSAKVTFDDGAVGKLSITTQGSTKPLSIFSDSLVWSITPITGSHFMVVPSSSRGHSVNFVFTNLPSDNDQFGNKYIKASLPRFNLAESVLVKVFFLKYAHNNPSDTLPNWYYYWRTCDIIPQFNSEILYDAIDTSCYAKTNGLVISITRIGADQWLSNSVCIGPYYCFGGPSVQGIDCTASVIAHEMFHQWLHQQWETGEWVGVPPPFPDDDGDGLPNIFETEITGTDPDNPDTYQMANYWPNYALIGDQEYWACVQGYGMTGNPNLDWSHGLYSKQWPITKR